MCSIRDLAIFIVVEGGTSITWFVVNRLETDLPQGNANAHLLVGFHAWALAVYIGFLLVLQSDVHVLDFNPEVVLDPLDVAREYGLALVLSFLVASRIGQSSLAGILTLQENPLSLGLLDQGVLDEALDVFFEFLDLEVVAYFVKHFPLVWILRRDNQVNLVYLRDQRR